MSKKKKIGRPNVKNTAARKGITVYLPASLHKALKKHCQEEGSKKAKYISMTDFVEALISKALNRN